MRRIVIMLVVLGAIAAFVAYNEPCGGWFEKRAVEVAWKAVSSSVKPPYTKLAGKVEYKYLTGSSRTKYCGLEVSGYLVTKGSKMDSGTKNFVALIDCEKRKGCEVVELKTNTPVTKKQNITF